MHMLQKIHRSHSRPVIVTTVMLATLFLAACEEFEEVVTPLGDYPVLNEQLDMPELIVNDAEGVGSNTWWRCDHRNWNSDFGVVDFTNVFTLRRDGTGSSLAFNTRTVVDNSVQFTWSADFIDNDNGSGLEFRMTTDQAELFYSDVKMPTTNRITAYHYDVSRSPAQPTSRVSCEAFDSPDVNNPVPLRAKNFSNGPSIDTLASFWDCESAPGSDLYGLRFELSMQGDGRLAVYGSDVQPVTNWRLGQDFIDITTTNGTNVVLQKIEWEEALSFTSDVYVDGSRDGVARCSLTNA